MSKGRSGRGGRPRGARHGQRSRGRVPASGTLVIGGHGSGTVETPEGTFRVSARDVGEAMGGDTVQVRPVPSAAQRRDGSIPGRVVAVLGRATTTFVATYVRDGALQVAVPYDARLAHDFVVDASDGSARRLGLRGGETVVARIESYPSRRSAGVVAIERLVGGGDEESIPIEAIIAAHGIETAFSPEALAEAEAIEADVEGALATDPLRRDIRGRFLVTVDPADARDFDDAVSIEPTADGGCVLGVHIADVTHYVGASSRIDLEARARATSVYLADRVVPMLPERLSNDVCSLRPDADRLAMTCDLALDREGRVLGADIYPSVIASKARLCYDEVDALLDGAAPDRTVAGVSLRSFFLSLDRVRAGRELIRARRGALEFSSVETKAVLDERGHAVGLRVRSRTRATGIIEEAMLAANEAVARFLEARHVPAAFRVHEEPSADALASLAERVGDLVDVDGPTRAGIVAGEPAALQRALDEARGTDVELVTSAIMLRAMKRARYLPENLGHFGLGAQSYCHFTSPIRRYPDLIVHRMLKLELAGRMRGEARRDAEALMPAVCDHSSKMERVAADAENESQDVKVAEYMGDRVGQEYAGTVVGVAAFGLFVQLDDIGVSGLLHVGELGGWCAYSEEDERIVDRDSGRSWRLGTRVEVRVRSVNVMLGRVDFSLSDARRRADGAACDAAPPGARSRTAVPDAHGTDETVC